MNAVSFLERQHAQLENLVCELRKSVEGERAEITHMLAQELSVHMALEEELFYPLVASLRGRGTQNDAFDEHHKMRAYLLDLLRSVEGDTDFSSKLTLLEGQLLRHARDEEAELFPIAREKLDPDVLKRLGTTMQLMAKQLHDEGDVFDHLVHAIPGPGADPGERPAP